MIKVAAALLLALSVATPAAARAADRTALVDTFLGTSTTPDGSDVIDDFPGADVPFGMVQWSPDTPSANAGGGYEYNDKAITGFSLTHLSGPGCGVFGDFRVTPVAGSVTDAHPSIAFTHANESASPGYYDVLLGNGVRTQIAVAQRAGIGVFTFPARTQANLLFDVSSDQAGVRNAGFHVTGPNTIEGFADTGGFCGMPDRYSVYFAAQFDTPIVSSGTWSGKALTPGATSVRGADAGGWVNLGAPPNGAVRMRVAISFVDAAGARANLAADRHGFDVDSVKRDASASWNDLLGRIGITGGTVAEQREFYTAFYHAMLHPNLMDDADGRYRGYDARVHRVRAGHHEYANFSDWDIYRTLTPLQALIAPDEVSDMMQSLVDAAHQDIYLPRWALVNGATSVMGGDSIDPVIAGAYAFGARKFDLRGALAAMVRGASDLNAPVANGWYVERPELREYLQRGYIVNTHTTSVSPVPNGASETLEYALDDFSIAQFARNTGNVAVYRAFMRRSSNWANLFDTASGLIAPRDASGSFMQTPITDAGQSGFQEGNAAQYTWMVPQDLADLIRGMGGAAQARAKLDTFFTQINANQDKPYAWLGNEPSLGSPWVYLSAGAPWSAQHILRQAMTMLYADSPHGMPGNDDLGTMSAWWIWTAVGLYPQNPSVRVLDIGSPLFTSVTMRSPHGPQIVIRAPQAADDAPYVQQLLVNGKPSSRTWIALPQHGNVALDFTLGQTANTSWGTQSADAPPSFAGAQVRFPNATAVTLRSGPVTFSPVHGQTFEFTIDNTNGALPETVQWSASLPPGVSSLRTSGTASIPAGGSQHASVTVRASRADAGIRNVTIEAQNSNGARIASLQFALTFAGAQGTYTPAFIANRFDDSITPFDPQTRQMGAPIAAGKEPRDEVLSPDRRMLYVADRAGNSVAFVNIQMRTVSYVKTGNSPNGTSVSPDGSTVWVANYDDSTVQAIDVRRRSAGKPISVGLNPRWTAVTSDGRTVFVSNQNGNTVTLIDAATKTVQAEIPVGAHPTGIAFTPDGSLALVANSASDDVTPIDIATRTALAPIPAGIDASMIAISPDGRTAFVSDFSSLTVCKIDIAHRTSQFIRTGLSPYGIAFSRDGKTAWVVLRGDAAVVPIDVATGRVGTPVLVGSTSPYSIVIP